MDPDLDKVSVNPGASIVVEGLAGISLLHQPFFAVHGLRVGPWKTTARVGSKRLWLGRFDGFDVQASLALDQSNDAMPYRAA